MKQITVLSAFLAVFAVLISGCSDTLSIEINEIAEVKEFPIDEEMAKQIWYSPEYQELAKLHHKSLGFIKEALDREITRDELSATLKSELDREDSRMTEINIDDLIFDDRKVAEEHRASVVAAGKSLIDRYPALLKLDHDASTCTVNSDKVDWFMDNYEAIYVSSQNSFSYGKTAGDDWPPCGGWKNSLLFSGCIVMAGSFCGPSVGGFALCAWGCTCMTCASSFPAICPTQ